MTNLAVELMPNSLDEVFGHEAVIARVKQWIRTDDLPYLIFLRGPSGTGKGCLIVNLIRTVLCLNRKREEDHNCGECEYCRMDPRDTHRDNNVMWIHPGDKVEKTVDAQVKESEQYALEPPRGDITEYHRYHKFIVLDEAQGIKTNLLQKILVACESKAICERNRVTYIIITMDEENLKNKNPILHDALDSRTGKGSLKLLPPSIQSMHKFASAKGTKYTDPQLRSILVDYAHGNYRRLISGIEILNSLEKITLESAQAALNIAAPSTRLRLWKLFNKAKTRELRTQFRALWESVTEVCGEKELALQLLNDLVLAKEEGSLVPFQLLVDFKRYLSEPNLIPLYSCVLAPYIGELSIEPPLKLIKETEDTGLDVFNI